MAKQLLHLVFGGELKHPDSMEFVDTGKLDIVGIYPSYAEALKAWRGAAARTVDAAHTRHFVVHLHRLLDPQPDGEKPPGRPSHPRADSPLPSPAASGISG